MSFLSKLAGVAVFVLALALALAVTHYYSPQEKQEDAHVSDRDAAPPPPPPPVLPGAPTDDDETESTTTPPPATSKAQLITLDKETRKCHLTVTLERDLSGREPSRLWVGAYFFAPTAHGAKRPEHWSIEPIEVREPFAEGRRVVKHLSTDCAWLGSPGVPSEGFYARLKISADSAAAARSRPAEMSFDLAGAAPVVVEAGKRAKAR